MTSLHLNRFHIIYLFYVQGKLYYDCAFPFFRTLEKVFGYTKKKSEKDDFALLMKGQSKGDKKKDASRNHCIGCLKTWPVSLSTRILSVMDFLVIPDVSLFYLLFFTTLIIKIRVPSLTSITMC